MKGKTTMKQTTFAIGSAVLLSVALLILPASRIGAQTDLSAKIAAAKTAADHEAIAAEFEKEAKDLEAQAVLHQDMAKHYGTDTYGHTHKDRLKKHCDMLSASLKKAAEQAKELAKEHHELAEKAGK